MIENNSSHDLGLLPALIDRRKEPYAAADLFSNVGLPLDVSAESERMLQLNSLIVLYEAAAMNGDPLFGLKAGQKMIDDYGT